jgi:hypothetical protein
VVRSGGGTLDLNVTGTLTNDEFVITGNTLTVAIQPPLITAPSALVAQFGSTGIPAISIADAFLAANPGSIVVRVRDDIGILGIQNAVGTVSGSGTSQLTLSGSLDQVNADLGNLSYNAAGAMDLIQIDATDSRGGNASSSILVTNDLVSAVRAIVNDQAAWGSLPSNTPGDPVLMHATTVMSLLTSYLIGLVLGDGPEQTLNQADAIATTLANQSANGLDVAVPGIYRAQCEARGGLAGVDKSR